MNKESGCIIKGASELNEWLAEWRDISVVMEFRKMLGQLKH
jgi:hypothetical protein